ncbi:hypothetical protein VB005_01585 [Metarhizium brunneum]
MSGYFHKLLRRVFRKKAKPRRRQQPRPAIQLRPIPHLPLPVLTAEDGIFEKLTVSGTKYGLFHRLPLEIRRIILAEAFGYRTIHIDLAFDHPLVRRPSLTAPTSSSPDDARHCGLGIKLVPDTSQPRRWQWFGCVCHRRAEWTAAEREKNWWNLGRTIGLHDDECIKGTICWCNTGADQGTGSDSCFIGIMGWLLSCRSACAEGLETLFSTSTFHISSLDLLLHLPELIYPRFLRQITSLELLWGDHERFLDQHPLAQELWNPSAAEHEEDRILRKLCRGISEACPNVQKLHVCIQFWVVPSGDEHPEQDRLPYFQRNVLGPIEDMLRGLGPRDEFNVTIPGGVWLMLFHDEYALRGHELVCELDTPVTGRFQKSLRGSGSDDEELSYWICSGWNDRLLLMPSHYSEYDRFWGRPLA